MADDGTERAIVETAAAGAWLAADEPATALPHAARALGELAGDASPHVRRDVLITLGEAAWRQRAWPDVIAAYGALVDAPEADDPHAGMHRYRLAVAAERAGDLDRAMTVLRPFADDYD